VTENQFDTIRPPFLDPDRFAHAAQVADDIIRDNPACATAPNGTGMPCMCVYECANYYLRAAGFGPMGGA